RPPAKPVGNACDDMSALTAPLPDAASVWVAHLLRAAVSPPTRRRSSPAWGRLAPYHLPGAGRGDGRDRLRRRGRFSLGALLPFVANATQLHPTTRLPQAANWLVSCGGTGCAWGPEAPGRCWDARRARSAG